MKQTDVKVPPILLEGDEAVAAPSGDQPEKFAVGPTPGAQPKSAESALTEGYQSGRLLLMARDPNCLYAHWDLTAEQQRDFRQGSPQGLLQVRIHREDVSGPLVNEVPVEHESRHTFIEVAESGAKYVAELGYPPPGGSWQRLAVSQPVVTPGDKKAEQQPIRFATLTFNTDPGGMAESIAPGGSFASATPPLPGKSAETKEPPLALDPHFPLPPPLPRLGFQEPGFVETIGTGDEQPAAIPAPALSLTAASFPSIPLAIPAPTPSLDWTPAQERALAELIGWSFLRHESLSSVDLVEVIRGEFQRAAVSLPGESPSMQPAAMPAPISSEAMGKPPEQRGFWFNVNAELVIYGATEPNAQVILAGQPVDLRPDGTFSCRFALPDGFYQLAIVATSAQGDVRRANLDFSRASVFSGEVGSHPQDPALKPPLAETTG